MMITHILMHPYHMMPGVRAYLHSYKIFWKESASSSLSNERESCYNVGYNGLVQSMRKPSAHALGLTGLDSKQVLFKTSLEQI